MKDQLITKGPKNNQEGFWFLNYFVERKKAKENFGRVKQNWGRQRKILLFLFQLKVGCYN